MCKILADTLFSYTDLSCIENCPVDQVTPTDGVKENAADSSTCKLVSFADYDYKIILFTSTLASALYSGSCIGFIISLVVIVIVLAGLVQV